MLLNILSDLANLGRKAFLHWDLPEHDPFNDERSQQAAGHQCVKQDLDALFTIIGERVCKLIDALEKKNHKSPVSLDLR